MWAEERRHRAVSGPVELVVGSIGDDCGKQVVPLGLVAVPAWLESLRLRTLELDHDRVSAVEADKTLCPMGMVAEVRPAAGLLPALTEAVRAIGIGVLDAVVIENFADAGLGPDLPAANACGLHRCAPRDPVAGVDAVDMLLDNVVAAQPNEVVPVVHLILHLGHARLPRAVPDSLRMEVSPGEEQVANGSVVDLADGFSVALCVP
jgi:hypothetical protein